MIKNGAGNDRSRYSPRPSKDSHEWYTPVHIIALAGRIMGRIDLDPASSLLANEVVGADCIYTKEDDGLSLEWYGRVWLNPPYGANGLTGKWWDKLSAEYDAGRVAEALFLANATTEVRWFQAALRRFPVLLIRARLSFWRPGGPSRNGFLGSALVYLPPRGEAPLVPSYSSPSVLSGDASLPAPPMLLSIEAAGIARFAALAGDFGQVVTAL